MNSKRFLTFGMRIGLPLAVAGMTFAAVAQAENWTLQGSNIYNNNSGNVGIGMSNPNRKLNVYNSTVDAVSPLTLSEFDQYISANTANNNNTNRTALYAFYANGTKNWGGSNRSLSAEAYNNGSGSVERLYGGFFSGGALGSGNITNLVLNNVTTYGGGTGIITNVVGVGINDLSVYNTPVNQYGIKMDNNTSAVGTNKYGLYIGNISGASSSNYSIYTGSADSYFGGNVGIGTTTPAARLDVAGNIKLSGASSSIISDGDICIGTCQ